MTVPKREYTRESLRVRVIPRDPTSPVPQADNPTTITDPYPTPPAAFRPVSAYTHCNRALSLHLILTKDIQTSIRASVRRGKVDEHLDVLAPLLVQRRVSGWGSVAAERPCPPSMSSMFRGRSEPVIPPQIAVEIAHQADTPHINIQALIKGPQERSLPSGGTRLILQTRKARQQKPRRPPTVAHPSETTIRARIGL